ncbi:DNA polymerase III subunit beta [Kiloniella sp.]|uniref:DNA polymerase III subunit beta n=1 Tax=Kiloniella sp. TaxID=1938587 RepID=UPI003B02CBF6
MNINIDAKTLKSALKNCTMAIEKDNTIPVLNCIRIRSLKGQVVLSATNMDMWIEQTIEAEIKSPGIRVFDPAPLMALLDDCGDDKTVNLLGLGGNEGTIQATVPTHDFEIQVSLEWVPLGDLPYAPDPKEQTVIGNSAGDLATHINKVKFAISNEETRYYLNGIYFHGEEDNLVTVATDGHRMATYKSDLGGTFKAASEFEPFILPRSAVAPILACLPVQGSNATVSYCLASKDGVAKYFRLFVADEVTITTKLIDGTYPDYKRVIPNEAGLTQISLDKTRTTRALKAFSKVAQAVKLKFPALEIHADGTGMDIKHRSEKIGDIHTRIPALTKEDIPAFGINGRLALDAIKNIDADGICMMPGIGEDARHSPIIFRGLDNQDPGFTCVTMPMRV